MKLLSYILSLFVTVVLFQNCGGEFSSEWTDTDSGSLELPSQLPLDEPSNDTPGETGPPSMKSGFAFTTEPDHEESIRSVQIAWVTNENSKAHINIGPTATSLIPRLEKEESFRFSSHSQTVLNLEPKTTYFYNVTVTNQAGETINSDVKSFETLAEVKPETPTPEPPPVTSRGQMIQNNQWTVNRDQNVSFGDHSGDRGFQPSQPGDKDSIRVKLKQGDHYGTGSYFRLPAKTQEAWMSFCLRFGYNWTAISQSGKLPGFSGHSSPTNGGQGGNPSTGSNAWSARMTFGKYEPEQKTIPLGNYIYHTGAHANSIYGDPEWWSPTGSFRQAVRSTNNRWYMIKQHIKMNTPGKNDGVLEAWFEGRKVYSRTNFNFTNNEAFREVYRIWLDVYYGGGIPSPYDQYVYFDQFNYSLGSTDNTGLNCSP